VSNFFGREEWWTLEPEFLDAHHEALSFFSEAGFRFFLPVNKFEQRETSQ
jgi:hypothetical protein